MISRSDPDGAWSVGGESTIDPAAKQGGLFVKQVIGKQHGPPLLGFQAQSQIKQTVG